MDLHITADGVQLDEPDVFTSFKVVVEPGTDPATAITPYGRLDDTGEHAFVTRAGLEALAGDRASDADWQSSLDAMLGYADSKGWTDDSGAVRAHLETA